MSEWNRDKTWALLAELIGGLGETKPQARKRRRILDAAIAQFVQLGYRRTSVDRIARQAGVAKGTIYLYYRNKAELLLAVVADEKKRLLETFARLIDPATPPEDRLRETLRMLASLGHHAPVLGRLIGGDMELLAALDDLGEERRAWVMDLRLDYVRSLLDAVSDDPAIALRARDERATVLIGLLYCAPVFADPRVRSGMSPERFGEVLADLLLDGIRPRGERS